MNGLSVAQQRAALRRLVVAFGEMNTIVDLAEDSGTPGLRAQAVSTRDLLGELVADLARPGGDRNCTAPAGKGPGTDVDRAPRGALAILAGRWATRIGGAGKFCDASAFEAAARRAGRRARRPER